MINGKFFTGLPAKMAEKRQTLNRQETHFFWPDDTQSVSPLETKTRRRTNSIQSDDTKKLFNNHVTPSHSDLETKERFKKEFTRSSIQFYDNDVTDHTPVRRNRQPITVPPNKLQNLQPPVDTLAKKKENLSSKIQFYDEDLNNVPKTNKNNKVELERNSKNSPKLQNKNLSFESNGGDEAINFIENDVRNMKITAPPRRSNTMRESRPRFERPPAPPVNDYHDDEPHYSVIHDDFIPSPRRRFQPQPQIRTRYPESVPDYDDYIPRRSHPRPPLYPHEPLDYTDGPFYGARPSMRRPTGRQMHYSEAYSSANEYNGNYEDSPPPFQRKGNISKVDNEERQQTMKPSASQASDIESHSQRPPAPAPASTSPSTKPTTTTTVKRNIRSSAVNRVSVGLPD